MDIDYVVGLGIFVVGFIAVVGVTQSNLINDVKSVDSELALAKSLRVLEEVSSKAQRLIVFANNTGQDINELIEVDLKKLPAIDKNSISVFDGGNPLLLQLGGDIMAVSIFIPNQSAKEILLLYTENTNFPARSFSTVSGNNTINETVATAGSVSIFSQNKLDGLSIEKTSFQVKAGNLIIYEKGEIATGNVVSFEMPIFFQKSSGEIIRANLNLKVSS